HRRKLVGDGPGELVEAIARGWADVVHAKTNAANAAGRGWGVLMTNSLHRDFEFEFFGLGHAGGVLADRELELAGEGLLARLGRREADGELAAVIVELDGVVLGQL